VKLKLDENLGKLPVQAFLDAGHDIKTVKSQQLSGAKDRHLISVCKEEGRCPVILDIDFGNPLLFPPEDYFGVAVPRVPARLSFSGILDGCQTLIKAIERADITGKPWIVQRGRIREFIREK